MSNHSLLIYNWISKYILHLVHSSILMAADTDAMHRQIVTNNTVVHNVEKNEVVYLSRNYSNLVLVDQSGLSSFYVLVRKCIHFLEENN